MTTKKRGQITLFIILAVSILLSLSAIFFLRSDPFTEPPLPRGYLEPQRITAYIESCVIEAGSKRIKEIAYNGGFINTSNFRDSEVYHNITYFYHCHQHGFSSETQSCARELITRGTMQTELNQYIKQDVIDCVNLTAFEEEGYDVEVSEPFIATTIGVGEVHISLRYPIWISKDTFSVSSEQVGVIIDSDLGYLFDLATAILNDEIKDQFFDIDDFLRYNGDTRIMRYKPYPHTLYLLQKRSSKTGSILTFKFGIEGFETVEYFNQPYTLPEKEFSGYCIIPGEENCYFNVRDTTRCSALGGTIIPDPLPDQCKGPSDIMGRAGKDTPKEDRYLTGCNEDGSCRDCPNGKKHGESWCVYEGPAGSGWDYVGSRHYRFSCYNGEIFIDSCRDYREEFCIEDSTYPPTAVCRINRWHDCSSQTDRSSCEDTSMRDCFWNEDLIGSSEVYSIKRTDHLCHPTVPPGFKHWTYKYNDVCQMANEWRRCDGWECPTETNNAVSANCAFQGDCGASRNYLDALSMQGFVYYNTIRTVRTIPDQDLIGLQSGHISADDYPLYSFDQDTFDDSMFENQEGTITALTDAVTRFIDRASRWHKCTFCDCIFGVPYRFPCTYDELTTFVYMCGAWQAPIDDYDCSRCTLPGDYGLSMPCTEYRCRSIGQNCIFETDQDGFSSCTNPAEGDTTGPLITIINITSDFDDNLYIRTSTSSFWSPIESHFVCRGGSCSGNTDSYGLEPYSILTIDVTTNKDAICKIFPLNIWDYDEIPSILPSQDTHTFARNHSFTVTVSTADVLSLYLQRIADFTSIYQAVNPTEMLTQLSNMKDRITRLLNRYGRDTSSIEDTWSNSILPMLLDLELFILPIETALTAMGQQTDAGQASYFIKCKDRAGNNQQHDVLIEFAAGRNTRSPIMLRQIPENGTHISDLSYIELVFNEPVECRWDYSASSSYESLAEKMECQDSFSHHLIGEFRCYFNLEFSSDPQDIFIRCLDQPQKEDVYKIHLNNVGSSLALFEPSSVPEYYIYIDSPNKLVINRTEILRTSEAWEIGYNSSGQVEIEMRFDQEKLCRYSTDSRDSYFDISPTYVFTCPDGSTICTTTLDSIAPDTTYSIRCIDKGEIQATSRNQGEYSLRYHQSS